MANEKQNITEEVVDVIFDALSEILCRPKDKLRCELNLSDRFVKDLEIDSDDLSFIFIPKLEKWVGTGISQEDWNQVWSIQDAIDVALRYQSHPKPPPDKRIERRQSFPVRAVWPVEAIQQVLREKLFNRKHNKGRR